MTIESAREQWSKRETSRGYCLPISLDSILRHSTLPDEYYDICKEAHDSQKEYINSVVRLIIEKFFQQQATDETNTPIAHFSAFTGSPQPYFPEVDLVSDEEVRDVWKNTVTREQLRLADLLGQARSSQCNVLFYSDDDHVNGLDLVDPGASRNGLQYAEQYIARDDTFPVTDRLYRIEHLSGLNTDQPDEISPLPEISRRYFPDKKTSWELLVFPPDPKS